ncbi:hypothetical protein PPL_06817 [Heterostelium album PN500]|uniref:Uncharacterized protein n=1 Tax=Heterostelium pallidum (strain ATCC 26659 / Pp 5 / PN500) TaxID=670386 RepID=D3BDL5_HETP5|nr:hypothetical protein PPL_06817 [Heterostelium album PN500]EFA79996.1 hypothetical protein PPL_06817 [Heterostelium album PN500]|eukprot:XP_020432116.1 hypothetical protein PPL_06817 [Heterostelium album PN500]
MRCAESIVASTTNTPAIAKNAQTNGTEGKNKRLINISPVGVGVGFGSLLKLLL